MGSATYSTVLAVAYLTLPCFFDRGTDSSRKELFFYIYFLPLSTNQQNAFLALHTVSWLASSSLSCPAAAALISVGGSKCSRFGFVVIRMDYQHGREKCRDALGL